MDAKNGTATAERAIGPAQRITPAVVVPVVRDSQEKPAHRVSAHESQQPLQIKCPRCGRFGCPANRGTHVTSRGIVRYRSCSNCGHVFQTVQRRAEPGQTPCAEEIRG